MVTFEKRPDGWWIIGLDSKDIFWVDREEDSGPYRTEDEAKEDYLRSHPV